MAKKKPSAKVTKARNFKPEIVYFAKKPKPIVVKKPKKAVKKHHRPLKIRRVNRKSFYAIIFVVALITTVLVWTYVTAQVRQATKIFDSAQQITSNSALKNYKQLSVARAVGSDEKLKSEIINLQSGPADLQKYVLTDYRIFKQGCVVNGQLIDNTSYEIVNVIYDKFAVIARTCSGTDKAILKKFDVGWAIAFSGNVYPPCSLTNDLAIPQGASLYCVQNGITFVNPNP